MQIKNLKNIYEDISLRDSISIDRPQGGWKLNYYDPQKISKEKNWGSREIKPSHKLYDLAKNDFKEIKHKKESEFNYNIDKKNIFSQTHFPAIYDYIKENLNDDISKKIVNRIKTINSLLEMNDIRINTNSLKYFILFSKKFISPNFELQLSNNGNMKCKWECNKGKLIISFLPNETISYAITLKSLKKESKLRIFTGLDNLEDYINSESAATSEIFRTLFYGKR